MMNPQMAAQHQAASYQNQQPQHSQQPQQSQQPQNIGQQKHTINGQQKTAPGQQQTQNSYAKYDPQLVLWSVEKPKETDTWEDVKPQKEHWALEELQDELTKFKRRGETAKRVLDSIKSKNCRTLINHLVEDQSQELGKHNKALRYIIAGIIITDWRYIDRRRKEKVPKRVQVILQTAPSGFQEPQILKAAVGGMGGPGNIHGAQDVNKSLKQPGMIPGQQQHGNPNNQGPNMAQQPRNMPPPGQHMGHSQQFDQRPPPPPGGGQGPIHGGGNAPPPPPPPPGGHTGHGHSGAGAPPPPPPPPPPPGMGHPPQHGPHNPHQNVMPGTFPGTSMHGMRPGQPPIQVFDPRFMRSQKPKGKNPRDSSSSEGSSSWESDTGSSGSESWQVDSVEDDFGYVKGERGRSKRSSRAKKSRRSKSQNRVRSRSASRVHHRSSRRRDSDTMDPLRTGRHSPTSSKGRSPNNSSGDERGHSHGKRRKHRDHSTSSPTKSYNKKNLDKFGVPMSRVSSRDSHGSWGRDSDANSSAAFSNRSVDSGGYGSKRHSHRHSRTHSYPNQHHSSSTQPHIPGYEHSSSRPYHGSSSPPRVSSYNDSNRREYARDLLADDYPYGNSPPREHAYEPALGGRPLPHRRYTTQANPMASNAVPLTRPAGPAYNFPADPTLRQTREPAYGFPAGLHERDYAFPSQQARYVPVSSPVEPDRFKMDEFADAFLNAIKEKDGRRAGDAQRANDAQRVPLRRYNTELGEEEWGRERGFPSARGAAYGPYSRYT